MLTEIKEKIIRIKEEKSKKPNQPILIAIDGKSGSGKSTLGERLKEELGGNLFHMDDFFLRPSQRTEERLEEIGGNVDYERFYPILRQIQQGETAIYQPYSCKLQVLEEEMTITPQVINIVEGSYSMHPYFGEIYDLTVALNIGKEEQRERILKRSGEEMLQRFVTEWIPKENAYLEKFRIYEKSHLVFNVSQNKSFYS